MAAAFASEASMTVCKIAAGMFLDDLLQSQHVAKQHLRHRSPQARLGALVMLRDYWNVTIDYDQAYDLVLHDEDTNVRCVALGALIKYAFRSNQFGRLFAEIVMNDNEPRELRYAAYLGLFAVRGWEDRADAAMPIKIPEDVDHAFVDSFLNH